jgi:hypothetical protein
MAPPARATSIPALLASWDPRARRLAELARPRILRAVPDAQEKLRAGWGLIGYNAPAYFAFLAPGVDCLRIGFEWGVVLPDPQRLLEGTGKQVRYVTIRNAAELRREALADLLREAASLPAPPRRR